MCDPNFTGITNIFRNIQNDQLRQNIASSDVITAPTSQNSFVSSKTAATPTDAGESLKALTQNQIKSLLLDLLTNLETVSGQSKENENNPTTSQNSFVDSKTPATTTDAGESLKALLAATNFPTVQTVFGQSEGKENDPLNTKDQLSDKQTKQRRAKKKPKAKISDGWIQIGKFSLGDEAYNKLIKNNRIQHYQMTSFLNKTYPDVPCILASYGKYGRSYERLTLRYKCTHSHDGINDCRRLYKVFQIIDNEFEIYRNDKDVTHNTESKTVGHVRGEHRKEVSAKLGEMGVEEYLAECLKNAKPELTRQGNLQDSISLDAAEKMRSEFIQSKDFDKDAIIDLLLMKICQDFLDKDPQDISNYIRRIGLDPFFITMFSDEQLKVLRMLEEFFTVYIDATGSVVKFGEKKIFYYAGVTPDTSMKLNPKERHRVLPLFECISSAHDSFNIGIWLSEFKHEFHKMFPTAQWPIRHAVTDFSYALLNAICWSWNRTTLLDYINYLYDALASNTPLSELQHSTLSTFLHICCCHLMKNFSKDVKEYFPRMDSEQQNILKEIFAGMFDITKLETLEKIWKNLSKILLSKHTNDDVEAALRELCEIMIPTEELLANHVDHEEDKEIEKHFPFEKLPDTDEHSCMYQNSRFYQHFKSIMSNESFAKNDAPINSFYSPTFATMFLQKYITILPLWTCFERKANSYVEGHFKDTKKNMISKHSLYGIPPLKPGRFIKIAKGRITNVVNAMLARVPRYRNTGRKRKAKINDEGVTKRTKMDPIAELKSYVMSDSSPNSVVPESTQMSDLYKRFRPRPQIKKRTPIPSIRTRTPSRTPSPARSSSHAANIDDRHVQEQWSRKSKKKFSYFNKSSLTMVQKSPTSMKKLLEKSSKKSSQRSSNIKKLPNHLMDQPETYLAPRESIIVARINTKRLSLENYRTLTSSNVLSFEVIDYIMRVLIKDVDDENVSFEISTNEFHFNLLRQWKETNHISFFVNVTNLRSTLVIVDWRKKSFCYVDPLQQNSAQGDEIHSTFQKCLDRNKGRVPKQFRKINLQHDAVNGEIDSIVAVMNFVDQYLKKETIDAPFGTLEYRLELQHRILRSSTNMSQACVVCGKLTKIASVQCDCCDRWTHCDCINQSEEDLKNDTIHYFCIICVANTSRSELHDAFKMVNKDSTLAIIPEETNEENSHRSGDNQHCSDDQDLSTSSDDSNIDIDIDDS